MRRGDERGPRREGVVALLAVAVHEEGPGEPQHAGKGALGKDVGEEKRQDGGREVVHVTVDVWAHCAVHRPLRALWGRGSGLAFVLALCRKKGFINFMSVPREVQ